MTTDKEKPEISPLIQSTGSIPEDVRAFIEQVTLHLQIIRGKTDKQNTEMFLRAYRLYVKYDVEGRREVFDSSNGFGVG